MMQLLLLETNYIFEFLISIILMRGFLGGFRQKKLTRACYYFLPFSFINATIEYVFGGNSNILFVNITILLIYLLLSFKDTIPNSIIYVLLIFCITMVIQLFITAIFIIASFNEGPLVEIIGNLLTLVIAILLSSTDLLNKLYLFFTAKSPAVLLIAINITTILLILNINHKLYPDKFDTFIINIIIPLFVFLIMNLIMIRDFVQRKAKENQLHMYQSYLPYMDEMIDLIRSRQHKYDNEIQTMKGLPNTYTTYESLSNALSEYSDYIGTNEIDSILIKLNYKFLASLLFQKIHYAKDNRVNLILEISSSLLYSQATEYELVDIAGVLIDNMIEATPAEASCKVKIESDNLRTTITTINPGPILTSEDRANFVKKGFSTKSNVRKQRGYGLYQAFKTIKEYDGKLFIENIKNNNEICIYISAEI